MQKYNKNRPHMSASDKYDKYDYFIGTKTLPTPTLMYYRQPY